jgi:expansin (peptidoglycan-binding protein)
MAGGKSYKIVVGKKGKMEVTLLDGYPEGTETADVVGNIFDGIASVTRKSHKGDDHSHAKTKKTTTVKA